MLPISFLSDYGHRDEWVGVCRSVIERIAPGATVIDIAHELPAGDVRHAACVLENAAPFLPGGVVLAVVDPGVGTERRPVVVRTGAGMQLVGPDNGLLWPAAAAGGGIDAAVDVSAGRFRLEPLSATFHGRDLFAPVAAHLARGAGLEDVGAPLDPGTLTRLEAPAPRLRDGGLEVAVRLVDRFGNVQLQARREDMEEAGLRPGSCVVVDRVKGRYGRTFADAELGEVVVYDDSSGWVAVAMNGQSAAARLGTHGGASITISSCES